MKYSLPYKNKFIVIFLGMTYITLLGAPVDCNQQCAVGPPSKPHTNQYPDPVNYPEPANCTWQFSGYVLLPEEDSRPSEKSCTLGGIPFWVQVADSNCPGSNPDPEYMRCGEPHPACKGLFQAGRAGWGFGLLHVAACVDSTNTTAFGYVPDEDVEGGWFVGLLPPPGQQPIGPAEWKLLTYF